MDKIIYCVAHSDSQCHYDEQIWDVEVGKIEEQSSDLVQERTGSADKAEVIGMREACNGLGNVSLLSIATRVVYNSLELANNSAPRISFPPAHLSFL